METQNKTPLWLDLRKEYVDDNFDKLLIYLQTYNSQKHKDAFYHVTIDLLRTRVEDLISNLANHPIYNEDFDEERTIFNIRLLCLYLLVDSGHDLALTSYLALMSELRKVSPRLSDKLLQISIDRLRHEKVVNLGFSWPNLRSVGTDLFAYNICSQARFSNPIKKYMVYENHGTVILWNDGLSLMSETEANALKLIKSGVNSVSTGVNIAIRTTNDAKLKQSLENSITGIDDFTSDFVLQMQESRKGTSNKKSLQYSDNDEAKVVIKSISYDGTIYVETVDPKYDRLKGTIHYNLKSLLYYYTDTLHFFLRPGDCLRVTVVDSVKGLFSFEKQFVDHLMRKAKLDEQEQDDFLCKLIDIKPTHLGWINEYGIPMYTENIDNIPKDTYAFLSIVNYGEGSKYGKIYARFDGVSEDDYFQEREVRESCLRDFAESTPLPQVTSTSSSTTYLSPHILNIIIRDLYTHQKSLYKPSERYKFLANAYILAEIIGDTTTSSYIKFNSDYLRILVAFVKNEDFSHIRLVPDAEYRDALSTITRLAILQLLNEYGRKDNSEILARTIKDYETSLPMLAKLARLIQTANSMQGTLSDSAINIIKREIIRTLSLETENDTDLEDDNAVYLGVESGTQEFKTSMVYPANNNMLPNETQQNHNILRAICAFLNSTTGGTLYIGVNDQGYITGIDNDMNFLRINSIDAYMRYIQDRAQTAFGVDVGQFLNIEPLYDNTIVAIHITPHPYRVVELRGTAYIRINAESREMPEKMKQELIARKILTNKDRAAAISQLQHACSLEKCVILHNYASSNSGKVSDRRVEAYDIRPEDGIAICYDLLEPTERKIKVFNLNRIGYVEILNESPWQFKAAHERLCVDAFHMTGTTPIHVSLSMDLFAKNLLTEEFPATRDSISSHKGDNNLWYFNADIFRIEPIARFYLGLANHITILKAPELEQYVQDFVQKYLGGVGE